MTKVELKDYPIFVGTIWDEFNSFLDQNEYSKIAILVDDNTKKHCLPILLEKSAINRPILIEIGSGEIYKNIDTCSRIWKDMMDQGMDRKSLCINLGGGVIGDMGGFCAATFKRGIDFIQIPTTLLSQVDSSIGGKLGIDFADVKNSVGLFKNPKAVFIDPVWLETLPYRELRSGFAEVIKHSLIHDASQWATLSRIKKLDEVDWSEIIVPSLMIKKRVVEKDPFENNIRKTLNFGHTIGHAVESHALHSSNPFLHGEAIAIGMICESYLSNKITELPDADLASIKDFILSHYGHTQLKVDSFPFLIHLMTKDKKNEKNEINFTMLPQIGVSTINQTCSHELIRESMQFFNDL